MFVALVMAGNMSVDRYFSSFLTNTWCLPVAFQFQDQILNLIYFNGVVMVY